MKRLILLLIVVGMLTSCGGKYPDHAYDLIDNNKVIFSDCYLVVNSTTDFNINFIVCHFEIDGIQCVQTDVGLSCDFSTR